VLKLHIKSYTVENLIYKSVMDDHQSDCLDQWTRLAIWESSYDLLFHQSNHNGLYSVLSNGSVVSVLE
jgi:hypothetical protein